MSTRAEYGLDALPDVSRNGAPVPPPPTVRPLSDLPEPEADTANELLRHRYLCRGGGLLLVGPTGIGKSSAVMQLALTWALGRECFGIEPSRPLRSLLVQAENDAGDLREMRDGVLVGLEVDADAGGLAQSRVLVATETSRTGLAFCAEVLAPLLLEHSPDLLWIDPAFAFIASVEQESVSTFLRNGLNPLAQEHGCGVVVVHHSNKPPSGRERPDWQAGDYAYLGSGSAEWANWARAVLALRSVGRHDLFELRAGKRGRRLGWTDANGAPAYHKLVGHSPLGICWRVADESELPATPTTTPKTVTDLLAHVPPDGTIPKQLLEVKAAAAGIGQKVFRGLFAEAVETGQAHIWQVKRPGVRPEVRVGRTPQTLL